MQHARLLLIALCMAASLCGIADEPASKSAGRSTSWWSLQPVQRPTPPAVQRAHWPRNPIDSIVLAQLEANQLTPAPEADRRTLIRRLAFDLTGLPPAPHEVDQFAADPAPDAYDQLVNRLLDSPHYGARWARHWLDIVRFGESNGFEFDEFRPSAWPYRDWIVQALNDDMPFDRFARLQLAGDVLEPDNADAIRATGFLVAGAYDTVGQTQQSAAMRMVVRQDELEDIVGTVAQTFLGLTVHCARCHDHKFDPVTQEEYYRMSAALAGVRHGERELVQLERPVIEANAKRTALRAELEKIERPVRQAILQERRLTAAPPQPIAAWDFTQDLHDKIGTLHGSAYGGAVVTPHGVRLDGRTAYVATAPLKTELAAKTLEAWVQLEKIDQRGGGVISVQALDGSVFDAIVFGEREPGRWMAGSDGFVRTQSFQGTAESTTDRPVHVAIVYGSDGTVQGYRDGRPYGQSYKVDRPARFEAGRAQVAFGLRHAPPGGNRLLAGTIRHARLYDRALDAAEIAASAAANGIIAPDAIRDRLAENERQRWQSIRAELQTIEEWRAAQTSKVYAVIPQPPEPAHLLIRGNPHQKGPVVTPGGVAALEGLAADFALPADAPDTERRKKLAEWITHPNNPLFARVIVNRLWHYHFGTGLVDTPNDFGAMGTLPSHPELLDWLAAELVDSGFRLKHVHRLIVTSATYRQSSRFDAAAAARDAGNRLLWRQNPRRLEAEAARDAILTVAGQLNSTLGGPGFREFEILQATGTKAHTYPALESDNPETFRRTLYRTWARGASSRFLDALDCPDPSTTAPRRSVTTTPLQALALLNNRFVLAMADAAADRITAEAGTDPAAQVEHAYRLALGRLPAESELSQADAFVREHGLASFTRAIFNSNEFLHVD